MGRKLDISNLMENLRYIQGFSLSLSGKEPQNGEFYKPDQTILMGSHSRATLLYSLDLLSWALTAHANEPYFLILKVKITQDPWFSGAYEEVKNNRIKSCA